MSNRGFWLARPISEVLCKFAPINCTAKISVSRWRAKQLFGRRTRQSARRPPSQHRLPLLQTRSVDWGIRRRAPPFELRPSGSCLRVSAPPQVERLSPERVSAPCEVQALDQSVQLDLSPAHVSVHPALDQSVQPDLNPERVSVAWSEVQALDQSVLPDLSPAHVSVHPAL